MIEVELTNRTSATLDCQRLSNAVQRVVADHNFESAEISVAIVDDKTIHELNRRYLEHDYATDVLSFVLDREADRLEGEIVVSVDTASANAVKFDWSTDDELLLYVLHGALHLVGLDDHEPEDRLQMRAREAEYLASFGCRAVFDADGRRLIEEAR